MLAASVPIPIHEFSFIFIHLFSSYYLSPPHCITAACSCSSLQCNAIHANITCSPYSRSSLAIHVPMLDVRRMCYHSIQCNPQDESVRMVHSYTQRCIMIARVPERCNIRIMRHMHIIIMLPCAIHFFIHHLLRGITTLFTTDQC